MDPNNAHAMAMAGMAAPNLTPLRPVAHHHQNPVVFPPSQPAITHPPPVMSPTAFQHQLYDPHYLHQPLNYGFTDSSINTLFVSGLPDDVKPREIHNLFRRRHGFDYCQLKYTGRGNQVVAFATFFNHQSAMGALHALNGVKFDPQTGTTLHIELARSNSRRKRVPGNGPYIIIDKRSKAAADAEETSSDDGDGGSDEPLGTDSHKSSNTGDLATTESGEATVDPDNAGATDNSLRKGKNHGPIKDQNMLQQSKKPVEEGQPPCSTLFVANLGPNCTEEELKQALSQYPGFHVLKMRAKGGMPVAFADFEDIEQATEAMEALKGSTLPSSDRGGLHLEYARSKMRKP